MKKATPEVSMNRTCVFWGINVSGSSGFDPARVRQCIKRLLKNYGHDGPLTIQAVGLLTDVHDDILRAFSSSGIILHYAPYGTSNIVSLMFRCMYYYPTPANILGICYPEAFIPPHSGFNLLRSFLYSSPQKDATSWINLILEVSLKEEYTCPETDESASWFCIICDEHPLAKALNLSPVISLPQNMYLRAFQIPLMWVQTMRSC